MQKRDVLMAEIERLGKIISQLLNGFKNNPIQENFEETNTAFLEKINLDINSLIGKNISELKAILKTFNFSFSQIENIAEYLLIQAEQTQEKARQQTYAQTANKLLEYINIESESISFSRMDFQKRLHKIL